MSSSELDPIQDSPHTLDSGVSSTQIEPGSQVWSTPSWSQGESHFGSSTNNHYSQGFSAEISFDHNEQLPVVDDDDGSKSSMQASLSKNDWLRQRKERHLERKLGIRVPDINDSESDISSSNSFSNDSSTHNMSYTEEDALVPDSDHLSRLENSQCEKETNMDDSVVPDIDFDYA